MSNTYSTRGPGIKTSSDSGNPHRLQRGLRVTCWNMKTGHPLARHICARTVDHSAHRTDVSLTTRTRVAQGQHGSSRLPWCVKRSLSSQRHVSHVAALATEHLNAISLTNITCLPTVFLLPHCRVLSRPILHWSHETLRDPRRSGGHTKAASPTDYEPKLIYSLAIPQPLRIEMDRNLGTDLQPRRIEPDRHIGTDPQQIPERILGDDSSKSCHRRYRRDWKIWCRLALRPIKDILQTTNQLKALQTRILKMENYEKCWLHRCMHMGEEKIMVLLKKTHSFRETRSKNNTEEKEQVHNRAQADHSRRESLKSNSSHEPRASGKPDALFSSRSDEPVKSVRKFYVPLC